MKLSRRQFLAFAGLSAAELLVRPRFAVGDTITDLTLPAVVGTPGRYRLTQNYSFNLEDTAALTILADDVEVDLQGFTIENSFGATTAAVGVYASNTNRVHIRNGTVRGFHTGVMIMAAAGGGGALVESLSIEDFTAAGIMISGASSIVRQNSLASSVRSTLYCTESGTAALGIGLVHAAHSRVIDNLISFTNTGPTDLVIGLYAGQSSDNVIVLDNGITNADLGVVIDEGIDAYGELRGTTTSGVAVKSFGGQDLDLV